MSRAVLVFLSLAIWMAVVEVTLIAAHVLGLRSVLASVAREPVSALLGGLGSIEGDLTQAGLGWFVSVLAVLGGVLDAQPERYLFVWSLPLVFFLIRWPALGEVSARVSGGPPPWLERAERTLGTLPKPYEKTFEALQGLSSTGLNPVSLQGVFGTGSDPLELATWWLSFMRDKGWQTGTVDAEDMPKKLNIRRNTAFVIDCRYNVEALRALLERLQKAKARPNGRALRVLVVVRHDFPTLVEGPNDPLLDLRSYLYLPAEASPKRARKTGFVDAIQDDAVEKRASKHRETLPGPEPEEKPPAKAPAAAPFVFLPAQRDSATLTDWLSSQIDRSTSAFGADGWRIVLIGVLLAPAPAALVDRLLPSTAIRPYRRFLFDLANFKTMLTASTGDTAHASGLSVPGLLLESQEVECLQAAMALAIERGGQEEVERLVQLVINEAPDRAIYVVKGLVKEVLAPFARHMPPSAAARFPANVRAALGWTNPQEGASPHEVAAGLQILAEAAIGKYGIAAYADWPHNAQILVAAAIPELDVAGRKELLTEVARWQGERQLGPELRLLAASPGWLARPAALQAWLAFLFAPARFSAPDVLQERFPDLLALERPWSRFAADDNDRAFLACFDTLERFYENEHDTDDDSLWAEEQVSLRALLASPDEGLALAAAWTCYWAAQGNNSNPPLAPFEADTVRALIDLCASPTCAAPIWRRAADTLHKIAAPPPAGNFVLDWARFADGEDVPRMADLEISISRADMAPVVIEARHRLEAGDPLVRVSAAMVLSIFDPACAGRAAAVLAFALQHPGLETGQEYLLMLRLAQCCDPAAARSVLRRVFVEGASDRSRSSAFLTLCGMRALDDLKAAVHLIPAEEDSAPSIVKTVQQWQDVGPLDTEPAQAPA